LHKIPKNHQRSFNLPATSSQLQEAITETKYLQIETPC